MGGSPMLGVRAGPGASRRPEVGPWHTVRQSYSRLRVWVRVPILFPWRKNENRLRPSWTRSEAIFYRVRHVGLEGRSRDCRVWWPLATRRRPWGVSARGVGPAASGGAIGRGGQANERASRIGSEPSASGSGGGVASAAVRPRWWASDHAYRGAGCPGDTGVGGI